MQDFIISTTPALEGYRVVKYLGPVVVPSVGAGDIIKDWLAGFTDIFGGKSHSYQKVFAKFINQGVREMSEQAARSQASAQAGSWHKKPRLRRKRRMARESIGRPGDASTGVIIPIGGQGMGSTRRLFPHLLDAISQIQQFYVIESSGEEIPDDFLTLRGKMNFGSPVLG